jgi:four helix bundle protein
LEGYLVTAIRRFEDIEAWQLARQLARDIHSVCTKGSFSKDWALRDQIDRSSGSVMDNIAEGFDGGSHPEFARFLGYAQRSCTEVQSQLYRALDRGHVSEEAFVPLFTLARQVRSKIGAFIKYLKGSSWQVREGEPEWQVAPPPRRKRRTTYEAPGTKHQAPSTKHQLL